MASGAFPLAGPQGDQVGHPEVFAIVIQKGCAASGAFPVAGPQGDQIGHPEGFAIVIQKDWSP